MNATRREAVKSAAALAALALAGPVARAASPDGPVKHFSILVPKPGVSPDELRIGWLGYQGQVARTLPAVRGLVLSEAFGAAAGAAPDTAFPAPVAGFTQAWFASETELQAALGSEPGRAWLMAADRIFDGTQGRSYTLREQVAVPLQRREGTIKRTLLLVRRPGLSHQQFLDHWLTRHVDLARRVPGLTGAIFNTIAARPGTTEWPSGELDGVTETWWETGPDNLGGKPPSPEADAWLADADNFLDLPRCRTITTIEHVLIAPH